MDHRLIIVSIGGEHAVQREMRGRDAGRIKKRFIREDMDCFVFFKKDYWSSSPASISYEHQSHSLSTIFIKEEAIFKIENWKRPQTQDLALNTSIV